MKRFISQFRFLIPLSLVTTLTACGNDPLSDPNSLESRAKTAADACQTTLDKVSALFNQCNPTTSDAYMQMQAMLSAAKSQIADLQKQLMMGTPPACTAPLPNNVWRCSNPVVNPSPVDTRLVLLTPQQVAGFGYPAGDCYVGVQKLTSLGSAWFYAPIPATKMDSPAIAQLQFPYNFPTVTTFDVSKDWACKQQ